MNPRILELAIKAYKEAAILAPQGAIPGLYFSEVQLEKFVESIVMECADIVADAVDHREPASTYVDKIKQHFGVES